MSDIQPDQPRKRGKALKYSFIGAFETWEDAKESLGSGWELRGHSSINTFHRCRMCNESARVESFQVDDIFWSWATTTSIHSAHSSSRGLTKELKQIIRRLYTSGVRFPAGWTAWKRWAIRCQSPS